MILEQKKKYIIKIKNKKWQLMLQQTHEDQ